MAPLLLILALGCSQVASLGYDRGRHSESLNKAPIIVRATILVEEVDLPQGPRPWSGLISVYQRVRYGVKEVLKGEVTEYEIEVNHLLFQSSPIADENTVSLSHEIFRQGNEVILLLDMGDTGPCHRRGERALCIRPFRATGFQAIPATEKNLVLVRDALAARRTQQ